MPSPTGSLELVEAARAELAAGRTGLGPDRRGGLGRERGKRVHQRAGSPVPSNRFF